MSASGALRLRDRSLIDVRVARLESGGIAPVAMGPDARRRGAWSALKSPLPELLRLSPRLAARVVDYGLLWCGVWPHPNVVRVRLVTRIDGRPFLALRYAEGGSVRECLRRNPPFATRLAWAQHIAAASWRCIPLIPSSCDRGRWSTARSRRGGSS
jgi:hypothetical protein